MMHKQIQGKRGFFSKKLVGPQVKVKFSFEDMLCFQKVVTWCFCFTVIEFPHVIHAYEVPFAGSYTNFIA